MIDEVPEHVEVHMANGLTTAWKNFGGKLTDLKSLYGFRLLFKKTMIVSKTVLNQDYGPKQAM